MNYDLMMKDIEDPRHEYPDPSNPEVLKRLKTLDEYLVIAKKVIKRFGPEYLPVAEVQKMAKSENAVTEIARQLMMADWRYQDGRGRTEYSYRNQCARWAIQDFLGLGTTKANQSSYSLDMTIGDEGDDVSLSSITEDKLVKEPAVLVKERERRERVKRYISFLMKNSKLTEVQAKCVYLRYFAPWTKIIDGEAVSCEGIESHTDIGQQFQPPISRQAVKQNLDRAIFKLRMTAKGT